MNASRSAPDAYVEDPATVAIDFLKQLRPSGPFVLTAILPDGPTVTITARDEASVRAFVCDHDGKRNIYYSVNPTRTSVTSKAAKVDIAAVEYVLADLDPRADETAEAAKARYLKALDTLEPKPTAVVDSGNGIQVLWKLAASIKLAEPVPTENANAKKRQFPPETAALVDDIEGRAAAMMVRLGSVAGTQNIDRILRLPGTTNLPNKKKLNAGRVACPTKLIKFNSVTCTLDEFPATTAGARSKDKACGVDIDALPISRRMKNLIRGIDDPAHPYESRSERVMAAIMALVAAGCSDAQIEAIFLDPHFPISAHILDDEDPPKYLGRQIVRAHKKLIDPDVAELNKTYAIVLIGGKASVMKTSAEETMFLSVAAFEEWLANRYIIRDEKKLSVAKHWKHHPQRRQYEGLTFAPGRDTPNQYNLWRGFSVVSKPGDCSKFLAHLQDNVCRGDPKLFDWVVGWFAQIVQHPNKKMGTALVLRGKQGTGKTKVGQVIGSLLGSHYVPVSGPRYITGQFNSHLVSCLLLHADEGFWAGDHAAEGKLKDLVTGDTQLIEFKGKEPISVRNFVRLLITGNPDWMVPAGLEERRFAVLDICEARRNDHEYFAAIDAEMNAGGREALLDHLLKFDIGQINLREIPKTDALLDQKISSMRPEMAWWFDVLMSGTLPFGCDEAGTAPTSAIYDSYIGHAKRTGVSRRSIETVIGMFLTKNCGPELHRFEGDFRTYDGSSRMKLRGAIYRFPKLEECRRRFVALLGHSPKWPEREGWVTDQESRDDEF